MITRETDGTPLDLPPETALREAYVAGVAYAAAAGEPASGLGIVCALAAVARLRADAAETSATDGPGVDADALWDALKRRCASTRPDDQKWAAVRDLVTVRKDDVEAALAAVRRGEASHG